MPFEKKNSINLTKQSKLLPCVSRDVLRETKQTGIDRFITSLVVDTVQDRQPYYAKYKPFCYNFFVCSLVLLLLIHYIFKFYIHKYIDRKCGLILYYTVVETDKLS